MSPASEGLSAAVARLRDEADDVRLPLDLPGADEARRARRELVAQLDDYALPRLRHPEAPLLAVVGGSTGAGRSTLVNSLVGREVSPAGVLRPTTRVPVLVCRAADRHWFSGTRVLPGLRRTAGTTRVAGDAPSMVIQVDDRVPQGLAVLDIPDIDSVDADNRGLAVRLLGAADVWLFVTTAARYADAVPWHLLRVARERTAEIAIVLNRVPDGVLDEVRPHFETLLARAGLGAVPLFALPETTLVRGMLTRDQIAPVRNWLYARATDADARGTAVRRTLGGVLGSLPGRASALGAAAARQHTAESELVECVDRAYGAARRHVESALSGGSVLTGEVLANWRLWAAAGMPESSAAELEAVVIDGVESLFRDAAERADALTTMCRRARPGGLASVSVSVSVSVPASAWASAWASAETGTRTRTGTGTEHPARPGDGVAAGGPDLDQAAGSARAAADWRAQVAARVPEDVSEPGRARVLLMVAALTGGLDAANEAGQQARTTLPAALAHAVDPVRASAHNLAADLLDADRERHLRGIRALHTGPGDRLREAADALRRAG